MALGAVALLVAPLPGVHTVTRGNRALMSLADLVHVLAAAAWSGGVVILAVVLVRRRRANAEERAVQLILRLSVVAAMAVVAVMLSGIAQSIAILDGPGQLVSSAWGRVLLVKVAFALLAGAIGAYNHRTLLPALVSENARAEARARSTVRAEAVALVTAAGLAAALVGAPT